MPPDKTSPSVHGLRPAHQCIKMKLRWLIIDRAHADVALCNSLFDFALLRKIAHIGRDRFHDKVGPALAQPIDDEINLKWIGIGDQGSGISE